MAGRRRTPRKSIKQRQPGAGKHPLMRWELSVGTVALGSAAAGDDFLRTLFDTSVRSGNKNCKVGKLTLQWFRDINAATSMFNVAIVRHKEGDAAPTIDDAQTIRDLRSDRKLIRGPFRIMGLGSNGQRQGAMKTVVLEDLLLDPNDDLALIINSVGATTGTNSFYCTERTWWKVTE